MKKIALLLGTVAVALTTILAFPANSKAYTEGNVEWGKVDYDAEGIVPLGITTDISFFTKDAASDISSASGYFDYANDFASHYGAPSDWEYFDMVALNLSVAGVFHDGDVLKIYVPDTDALKAPDECTISAGWSYTVTVDYIALHCKQDSSEVMFHFLFKEPSTYTPPVQSTSDWLEPLMSRLRAAAGVSGNPVVEYSGDFSLPYAAMKILKDHPNVTLKYTLTVNNEKNTFVIGGSNVVADPAIPWYGPDFLKAYYGENAEAASNNASSGQYLIMKGDTLSKIAAKLNVSLKVLAEKNGIKDVNYIIAGRTLNY